MACSNPSELATILHESFYAYQQVLIVEKVVNGESGLLETAKKDTYIIDMTTGEPEITRKISKALKSKEINFIDAPVSGGPKGANQG